MTYYYLMRVGVNQQGLFAIDTDMDKVIDKAIEFASDDVDDYHTWEVMKHVPTKPGDYDEKYWRPKDEVISIYRKGKEPLAEKTL